jgi:hypothetical protein
VRHDVVATARAAYCPGITQKITKTPIGPAALTIVCDDCYDAISITSRGRRD